MNHLGRNLTSNYDWPIVTLSIELVSFATYIPFHLIPEDISLPEFPINPFHNSSLVLAITNAILLLLSITLLISLANQRLTRQDQSHNLLEKFVSQMQIGALLLDKELRVILANPTALELLGVELKQIHLQQAFTEDWSLLGLDGEPIPLQERPLQRALAHKTPICNTVIGISSQEGVITDSWSFSSTRWLIFTFNPIYNPAGELEQVACSFSDITERRQAEEKLYKSSFFDRLTGLPNRALLMKRLQQLHKNKTQEGSFALLFLDIDRFKVINDSLGHIIGDQLLVEIAQRLRECIPKEQTIARLGGDEFTILLENITDVAEATDVAEKIYRRLLLPFNLNGQQVYTSASIGIALSRKDYEHPEELLRDADIAMYQAKARNPKSYELCDQGLHIGFLAQLQMETELRLALEREEFLLHYQPIISLETGQVTGFEALVRWQHPRRGLVSPSKFLTLAEETDLILPLSKWILREACSQLQAWLVEFPQLAGLTVAVNLSPRLFLQPDLVEQIEQTLRETGLDRRFLKLEVTESVMIENAAEAIARMMKLQSRSIGLSLDDFGTGYSSLSYLHRFPINTLKIDRAFIQRIGQDGKNLAIVQAIVDLARNLQMDVIAEGVENVQQLVKLKDLHCQQAQGYFFAKPLSGEQSRSFLAAELLTQEQLHLN